MARTVRRKQFASTLAGYVDQKFLKTRHDYEHGVNRSLHVEKRVVPGSSYEEYAAGAIQGFNRDGKESLWSYGLFWRSVPREVRRISLKRQTMAHKAAIRRAIVSGDLDVFLQARDSRELIDWWMYY